MIRGGNKAILHRQLKQFLEDMETEYGDSVLYNHVRFEEFEMLKSRIKLFNNPLCVDIENQQGDVQFELCGLQADPFLQTRQEKVSDFFTLLSKNRFTNLPACGQKMTSMSGSTYICESVCSTMKFIKNHNRSRLTDFSLLQFLKLAMAELHVDIPALASAAKRPLSSH
ncbi:general transcription factor II-I repeat domain-containing protein 2-like [Tachypleus tridentatus]|uniref:general transcription factor II-I repeat domain-containing protein 2-like n=1 Tax=Tachypleus tridentatus TaxID=6853 RepID=UPI003FD16C5E